MGLVVHLVLVVVAALVVNGVRDRRIRQNTTPPTAPTTIPPVIQECVWDRIHMPVNRPLILDSQKNIVLPVREWRRKIIRVPAGTNLTFACSGSTFSELPKVAGVPVSTAAVHAVCVDGRELNMDGKV
ncbi:unnamed protein product [Meganyctiphanes norvegica]|uniref:Uncharacterized protein n=1 Tax=Meganyctiphanes norvegica TaxID=48144 RepID=A0AAV2SGM6_MEGNR